MEENLYHSNHLDAFEKYLEESEHAPGTVEMYCRDVRRFLCFAGEKAVTKELALAWKEHIVQAGYAPVTVNTMLAALNAYLEFLGMDFRLKALRVQRRVFRDRNRELTQEDYRCLLTAAQNRGDEQLALLMETIAATGIRVSELPYITVEAVQKGDTRISLKGKIREILLPGKLCCKLQKYARKKKIASGAIFVTESGRALSRKTVWARLKSLCKAAGVSPGKVFPHNLRHLFARVFYRATHDVVKLADILGHSSVNTTRIYLIETGQTHVRQMERLGLVQ